MTPRPLDQRIQRVATTHLHPLEGSSFWLDRAAQRGIDASQVQTLDDLRRLGPTTIDDLRARPLLDYVPRRFHADRSRLIVGQTGGTTGQPVWTAYLPEEFDEAFVTLRCCRQSPSFPAGRKLALSRPQRPAHHRSGRPGHRPSYRQR